MISDSNLDLISIVTQNAASDEIYSESASSWINSKYGKLLEKYNKLSGIILDPEITPDYDATKVPLIVGTGEDYTTLEDIRTALLADSDEVVTALGEHVEIDTLVENFNSAMNETKTFKEAIDSAKDSVTLEGTATTYLEKIRNIISFDGSFGDQALWYYNIIADKSKSAKDKILSLVNTQFDMSNPVDDESSETAYLAALNNSNAKLATGNSASKQIALATKDFVESIDYSSVKSAIVSGAKNIWNGIKRFGKHVSDNIDEWCGNAYRKIGDFLDLQHCDIICKSGGNGCIDNACYVTGLLTPQSVFFYNSVHSWNFDMTKVSDWVNNKLKTDSVFTTDIPGAELSACLIQKKSQPLDSQFKIAIRPKLIDYKSVFNVISGGGTLSEIFNAVSNMYASEASLDSTNYSYDDYYWSALLMGKSLAYHFLRCVAEGRDFSSAWTNDDTASIVFGCTTNGSGLNTNVTPTQVTVAGVTYNDPTNAQFFELACQYAGQTDWVGGMNGNNAMSIMTGIAVSYMSMLVYGSDITDRCFIPYSYLQAQPKGSFSIMTDGQVLNQAGMRAAGVIAVAATVAAIAFLPTTKQLREKAVLANLKAGTIQSEIQKKLAAGQALTDEELSNMYKATKKAVRLNKLTGGFGSITTGLSTWQDKIQSTTPNLAANNTMDIKTLIVGS